MATSENVVRQPRVFAIVPAAGQSRRMGRPKLLLPCSEGTLIERVLTAWSASRVARIVVVARRDDAELIARCGAFTAADRNADEASATRPAVATTLSAAEKPTATKPCVPINLVLPPVDPPDMKDSVACALRFLRESCAPSAEDAWLLAPADMPDLAARVIDALIAAHDPLRPSVLAPRYEGRRGHPVLFPWYLSDEVLALGPDEGVNALLRRHPAREIAIAGADSPLDIDTPEDFARWQTRHGE